MKNSAVISGFTLSSRILGLVRDALIATAFGTTGASDAFFIAFRPFDLVRKMFSEGVLSISLVPVFMQTLSRGGRKGAAALVWSCLALFSLAGIVVTVVGFVLAPALVDFAASGFSTHTGTAALSASLFRIMLPYIWLIFLSALCMGVLNSLGHFGLPALAPVVFNLTVITFTLWVCNRLAAPVTGLALGVAAGGLGQFVLQVPLMRKAGMLDFSVLAALPAKGLHSGLGRMLGRMVPCMIGAAAFQINIVVASFMAARLSPGSVSHLYFADRMVQFPLALFAISVSTAVLPDLSLQAARDQPREASRLFSKALRLVIFITVPAMAGLMALDMEIIRFLFGHGRFDGLSVTATADCLFVMAAGLWAFTGTRIFVTLHYAFSSIRTPFLTGCLSIGLNVAAGLILVGPYGLKGLLLGVGLSSGVGFTLLFFRPPKGVVISMGEIFVCACRSIFLSGIMLLCVEMAAPGIDPDPSSKLIQGAVLLALILLGAAIYLAGCLFFRSPELMILIRSIRSKGSKTGESPS